MATSSKSMPDAIALPREKGRALARKTMNFVNFTSWNGRILAPVRPS
jgi:hypothetical protein